MCLHEIFASLGWGCQLCYSHGNLRELQSTNLNDTLLLINSPSLRCSNGTGASTRDWEVPLTANDCDVLACSKQLSIESTGSSTQSLTS